jgi:hypothetical protein
VLRQRPRWLAVTDPEVTYCDWRMPGDSKMGELECIREPGHDGKHYVYQGGRGYVYVYEVDEDRRVVTLAIHARIDGLPDKDMAAAVAWLGDAAHARSDGA